MGEKCLQWLPSFCQTDCTTQFISVHRFAVHPFSTRCYPVWRLYIHNNLPHLSKDTWAEMLNVRSWIRAVIPDQFFSFASRLCYLLSFFFSFLFSVLALTLLPLAQVSPWAGLWLLPARRILFKRPRSRDLDAASGARRKKKSFLSLKCFDMRDFTG